jgi:hypothetical protein
MILTTGAASAQPGPAACSSVAYRGFDSRLDVELVARVDLGGAAVTGFEIAKGRPVIAFERRLLGIDNGRLVSMPSLERIDALAVDAAGRLWVQHGKKIRRVSKDKLEAVAEIADGARLHNSGHVVFLQSASLNGKTRLVVHAGEAGRSLPPLDLEGGKLASVGWNPVGMAAVIGSSLVTWPAGGKKVTRLLDDEGLLSARDVSLVSASRAVVALPNTLALVTERGIAVLALIRARVRWADDALYVLDETWGLVWKISGLERLGTAESDKAHAAKILKLVPSGAPDTHPAFLEAARIVGCEGARKLAPKRR